MSSVADATANADSAPEIGKQLAVSFNDTMFTDMKVKRKERTICMRDASGKVEVRGRDVEYSFDLLFCRVSSVITSPNEMKEFMK